MAITNSIYGSMGGPLDALLAHVKNSVNGKEYSLETLKSYVQEQTEEFSKETVRKKLSDMLATMSAQELAEQTDIGCLEALNKHGDTVMLTGNPLYMAIYIKDEQLIRGMMEQQVPLMGAKRIYLWQNQGIPNETGKYHCFLSSVLMENDINLSEELWASLWGYYAKQPKKVREAVSVEQSTGAFQPEMLKWISNLLLLKQKYPKIYKKSITEELFNRILGKLCTYSKETEPTKKEKQELVRQLKELDYPLRNQKLLWKQVKQFQTDYGNNWLCNGWDYCRRYMLLWKKLSGQPVIAEMTGTERELFTTALEGMGNGFEDINAGAFLKCMCATVDWVKYAECLESRQVFQGFMKEGMEEELLGALRISLISSDMLSEAFQYAEENNLNWAIPMLMLKQHGEWTPEARYEA